MESEMKREAIHVKRRMYDWLVRQNTQYPDIYIRTDDMRRAFTKMCGGELQAAEYISDLLADGYAKGDGNRIAAVIGNDRPDVKDYLEKNK